MKKIILLCFLITSLVSCKIGTKKTENTEVNPTTQEVMVEADAHNARIALDYCGVYEGVIPCADCAGIKVNVTLNKDETYIFKSIYLKDNKTINPSEFTGRYTWNDKGSIVTLNGITDSPSHFFVVEGAIIIVDAEGKQISGNLADHYRLKQIEVY